MKKKEINYGSPKYYQKAWNKFTFGKARLPFRGYCKKLKTKHDFILKSTDAWSFMPDTLWRHYECSGCGKGKVKTVKIDPTSLSTQPKKR